MLSLVIPVYRNEDTIEPLLAALEELQVRLKEPMEVVFVVDGSPDESFQILRSRLPQCRFASGLVLLSRNFGAFAAIRVGLMTARGPYFAVMAADLQEPLDLMEEFFRSLSEQPIDVVVGQRSARHDPPASRWAAATFWWLYRFLVQKEMPPGGIDVFGCNQKVRDALLRMEESHSSLVGQLIWLGFRRKIVPYVRRERVAGRSSWTFRKKFRYMLDSVFAFTELPIRLVLLGGVLGIALSTVVSCAVLAAWVCGSITVRGYTPLMLGLMFSTSIILAALGIIGDYVWRAFENTKHRPTALPILHETFNAPSVDAGESHDDLCTF